jgi:hypothetical protein
MTFVTNWCYKSLKSMDDRQRVTSSLGVLLVLTVVFDMGVFSRHPRGDVNIASSWESHLDTLSACARIAWANQHSARLPKAIAIHYGILHHSMESAACGLIIMNPVSKPVPRHLQPVLQQEELLKLPIHQDALGVP